MNTISETDFHIGTRIGVARRLHGMSQEALAQKIAVTPEQVGEYELGRSQLTAGQLYAASQALQVSVSFFYQGLADVPSCPYALSDERFALLRRALLRLAVDHEISPAGYRKKLLRIEVINIAREICEVLGWNYGSGRSNIDAPAVVRVAAE
jgi:transcriptional regulator with XRE-family HTH domain